ncbi:MAG: GHKL domain-containing protein [Lachnospiraceae bacterium]|nr:GHKL domain-containing protein [Lachnospiraceae bacterium]
MFSRYEKKILDYQRKAMEKQVAEVNEIYMTMRGWRHDYHNHLQKLGAHLQEGQIEEARKYIGELGESLDDIKTKYQTGNVSLDAILNSKLSIVEKERIAINCKVEIGENLAVSDIDLCILLGNLIDNAVEACRGIPEEEERFLRIYMCIRKQQLYISVSNATNEVIRKLDAEYISKKRGDHGHGLKRINIVVDKYGGFIKRANEPGVFATEIMLPL